MYTSLFRAVSAAQPGSCAAALRAGLRRLELTPRATPAASAMSTSSNQTAATAAGASKRASKRRRTDQQAPSPRKVGGVSTGASHTTQAYRHTQAAGAAHTTSKYFADAASDRAVKSTTNSGEGSASVSHAGSAGVAGAGSKLNAGEPARAKKLTKKVIGHVSRASFEPIVKPNPTDPEPHTLM